jgi:hypothetical protein
MECAYTHLNHNLLVSPKKKGGHQGSYYKGGLQYQSYYPHLSTLPSFISALVGGVTL